MRRSPLLQLVVFFTLTFAATWSLWLLAFRIDDARVRYLVFLIGVFAPAFVALALTAMADGRAVVRALINRVFLSRVPARWYLFAITYMAAIKLATALIHRLVAHEWPRFGEESWLLLLVAIPISTPTQSGEEVGWRGYALPRLADLAGLRIAGIVLGVIWAFWHLPLFLIAGTPQSGQSFPTYALGVTAISVAMTWLYAKTSGSLLLTMLMHSAINQATFIVRSDVPGATNAWALSASLPAWLTVTLLWVGAAYFLIRMPRRLTSAIPRTS